MAVAGALIGGAIGAFGKKPKVPTLATVDPDVTQKRTVAGNLASFADVAKLATTVNVFNQEQLDKLLERVLPGAKEQIQKTIGSQLRGEVPEDVGRAITRYGAERGVGALTRGSGFGSNVTARDLGLTSLGLIEKGLSSAESWLARASAPQMDVTSMFFTPQQRLAFEQEQQALKFERDVMAAGVKAMPDPATAALGKEIDRFFNTWAQAGMMGLGSIGGGAKGPTSMSAGFASANQGFGVANPYVLGGYNLNSQISMGSANGAGL